MSSRKYRIILALFPVVFFVFSSFAANPIMVTNESNKDLFMAVYYDRKFSGEDCERATDVFFVPTNLAEEVDCPRRRFLYDRELVFTTDQERLKPILSEDEFNALPSKNVGTLQGKCIFLAEDDGQLKGYNLVEWRIFQVGDFVTDSLEEAGEAVLTFLTDPIKNKIKKEQPAFQNYPYKDTVARVRVGNELNVDEKKAQKMRFKRIKKVLEKKIGPIQYTPKIAFVASGGGYRSMLCTLGFLAGAQKIKLLDSATWITSLSGSTWALATWLTGAKKSREQFSIDVFRDKLFDIIVGKELYMPITPNEIKLLTDAWLVCVAQEQPLTLVSVYGALLANRLLASFEDERHMIYLSQQADLVKKGKFPIPIYTASDAQKGIDVDDIDREWFEFTPWEVGGAWLNCYVPTWAYGRRFDQGTSTDFGTEKTLGFNLGTYGSAFAVTVERVYDEIKGNIRSSIVKFLLKKILAPVEDLRLSWAQVFNFSRSVDQSPLKDKDSIRMADGGIAFNLPYPPVSGERPERKADILIFLDASSNVDPDTNELRGVQRYARRKNLKFPTIDYRGISDRAISVFKDETDPEVPVVIYMPRINDKSLWGKLNERKFAEYASYVRDFDVEACVQDEHCDTLNFDYTKEEAMQLSKTLEFNMRASEKIIFREIKELIERKAPAVIT